MSIHFWWWGLVAYAIFHAVHVVVWQFPSLRRREFLALGGVLLVAPSLFWMGFAVFSAEPWNLLAPAFTQFSAASSYIAIYPAFQASSPTIDLLHRLRKNRDGLDFELLAKQLAKPGIVEDRVNDLIASGLILRSDSGFALSARGQLLVSFFRTYRRVMGLPVGAG